MPVLDPPKPRGPELEGRSLFHNFKANAFYGVVAQAFRLSSGMFLIGYTIRHLGPERWGLVAVAMSIVSLIALIEVTVASGMGKKVTEFRARADIVSFRQFFTAGVVLSIAIAFATAFILCVVISAGWQWFNVAPHLDREGKTALALIGLSTVVKVISFPVYGCLQAAHRIDVKAKATLGEIAVRMSLVVLAFEMLEPSASLYAAAVLCATLVAEIGPAIWVVRHMPEARFDRSGAKWPVLRDLVSLSTLVMFNSLNYTAFMQSPTVLLQRVNGLAAAGSYGIALQLNNLTRTLITAVNNALNPVLISLKATNDQRQLERIFLLATKSNAALAGLIWLGFFFLGSDFLQLWIGAEYHDLDAALPWLIATAAVGITAMPSAAILVAAERLQRSASSGFALAVIMILAVSAFLSTASDSPMVGVSVLQLLFFGGYQLGRIWEAMIDLRISFRKLVLDLIGRVGLCLIPVAIYFEFMSQYVRGSWPAFVVAVGGSVIVFGFSYVFGLLAPSERATIRSTVFAHR